MSEAKKERGCVSNLNPYISSCSMMTSFMPEIYAMTVSVLEIWVIRSAYKLIYIFIAPSSVRCVSS